MKAPQGISKGQAEEKRRIVKEMYESNISEDIIAKCASLSVEQVQSIFKS